jgi:hypothetical protein
VCGVDSLASGTAGDDTVAWCRRMGFALVAADELHHETHQPDRNQKVMPLEAAPYSTHTALYCTVKLYRPLTWGP